MMRWTQVTAPTDLPLDVALVREFHLRSPNGSIEDEYIEGLIAAAVGVAERETNRVLMPQTWRGTADRFPSGAIEVRIAPLIRVVSIAYIDGNGDPQTLETSPSSYEVINPSVGLNQRARIVPTSGSWPETALHCEAVTVTVECGYADEDAVPAPIAHGIRLIVGELYKQRSESVHAFNHFPAVIRAKDLFRVCRIEPDAAQVIG